MDIFWIYIIGILIMFLVFAYYRRGINKEFQNRTLRKFLRSAIVFLYNDYIFVNNKDFERVITFLVFEYLFFKNPQSFYEL